MKALKIILVVLFFAAIAVLIIRILTPEDTWVCKDGSWEKHGNPIVAQPTEVCR